MTAGLRWASAWLAALLLPLLLLAGAASASTVRLGPDTLRLSLEGRLEHFSDASRALSFEDAQRQAFVRLPDFRSLGYDRHAHWFRVELNPAPGAPARWVFSIGSPELEEVDVWVERGDGGYVHHAMGYHRPYENRPLRTRLFAMPTEVFTGMQIYFRVRTANAINVHAELWQVEAFTAHETRSNFYRGMYFGILLIAVALHAILGMRLRDVVMAAYAGYIVSQMLFNLGTNGYLPVLLAQHAEWFTDALPRIGWLGGAASIVLMWDRLLGLKQAHPHIHRLFLFTVVLNLALLPFALVPAWVGPWLLVVVKLANALNSLNFLISLILLLRFWRRSRRDELMVYFVAFIIPAIGATINTATNMGMLPHNAVTSNFYQAASLVHVLVMSYGLGLRLRQLQYDKTAAQQEAAIATRRSEEQRRFVAMLSHEFGNPLAAIDRAAQIMQIKLPDLQPPEARRLAQIRANAAMLSGFVDNFLMTEALDHGGLALSVQPCALREMLARTIRIQGDAARERIVLRECPDEAVFSLDATLIGVAVGNLLANALRYSPATSQVEVEALLDRDGLRIRIADQGPGMSDEELEKLGTPYFRASTSLGQKGSGLGYHFTRRIVQAHGGRLTARSTGAGMEVEIFLPSSGHSGAGGA